MPLRILGHLAQLLEAAFALRRLAFLQPLLVGHGLLLHVLDVERPASIFILVEIGAFASKRTVQKIGEVPGFVDARVQAEAADGIVDMGCIAAEKHPALAEVLRHALVHVVEIQVQIVSVVLGNVYSSQPCPYRCVRKRFLVALILARVEHCAPATL